MLGKWVPSPGLLDLGEIKHGFAQQAVNRVLFAGFGFNQQRPVFVGLGLVARYVLCPKIRCALGVLRLNRSLGAMWKIVPKVQVKPK